MVEVKEEYNPEEEIMAEGNWKIIDLDLVDTKTGDEEDECLFESIVKLYRFDNSQWKERAIGTFKFLKRKESGKVVGVLRQDDTNRIMANFYGEFFAPEG